MKRNGFTLFEVALVLGISALIATPFFLILTGTASETTLEREARKIASVLRDAQSKAQREGAVSASWTVTFINASSGDDTYTLSSSIAPTTTYALPNGLEFSDPTSGNSKQVIFAALTGLPNARATTTIRLKNKITATKDVVINSLGAIR